MSRSELPVLASLEERFLPNGEGWLKKRVDKGGRLSAYQKRWCVLHHCKLLGCTFCTLHLDILRNASLNVFLAWMVHISPI